MTNMHEIDTSKVTGLSRTLFKKRGNLGRYRDVWLELDRMALMEYQTSSATKAKRIDILDSDKIEYMISDGSTIGESDTLIITSIVSGKKGVSYYKAKNSESFHLWLRYLRRAVGANRVITGKAVIGIDISLFEDPACLSDIDGNLLDVNDGLCLLLGYEKSELIGKHNTIMMPTIVKAKHDWYMKNYENDPDSAKKLGCPRICNALHKNGKKVRIQITLGQIETETGRQYITTLKDEIQGIGIDGELHRIVGSKSESQDLIDAATVGQIDDTTGGADSPSDDGSADSPRVRIRTGRNGSPATSPTSSPITSPIYSRRTNRKKRSVDTIDKVSPSPTEESEPVSHSDAILFDAVDDLIPSIKEVLSRANRLSALKMSQVITTNRKLAQDKNELHQTISELDAEARRLRVTTLIQKRALDSLITFGSDVDHDIPKSLKPEEHNLFSSLKQIVIDEIRRTADTPNSFFREDSLECRKIRSAFFTVGASYLHFTMADAIAYIRAEIDTLEPDILTPVDDKRVGEHNVRSSQRFIRRVARIIHAIETSVDSLPQIIKEILIFARAELRRAGYSDATQTVTSFLFLRFYVPPIADPESFGLIGPAETICGIGPNLVRTSSKLQIQMVNRSMCWALIARIVQSLANDTLLSHQDPASQEINSYLQKNNRKVKKFMGVILS
jgi:PAS domain S-box-containing protein